MSTPVEQARAIAQARHFLSELCVPGKIKRIPREVRREARDRPRAVNGDLYRRNFETIFPDDGKNFDYPEGSKTKEQRIAAMIYGEQMMKRERKPYPDWICDECGRLHGRRPEGNPYGATYHIGECGVCGTGGVDVTEPRDFGHLKEGWDK